MLVTFRPIASCRPTLDVLNSESIGSGPTTSSGVEGQRRPISAVGILLARTLWLDTEILTHRELLQTCGILSRCHSRWSSEVQSTASFVCSKEVSLKVASGIIHRLMSEESRLRHHRGMECLAPDLRKHGAGRIRSTEPSSFVGREHQVYLG